MSLLIYGLRYSMMLLSAILLAGISGCASITQGTSQTLIFSIEPKETRCVVTRVDDGQLGIVTQSQNTLMVSKDKDDIIVQCNADGYKPYTFKIVSSATGAGVAGAIFIDLGITDMITGAMWRYPDLHNITLEKVGSTALSRHVTPNEEPTQNNDAANNNIPASAQPAEQTSTSTVPTTAKPPPNKPDESAFPTPTCSNNRVNSC